jgi:hypothetical protein
LKKAKLGVRKAESENHAKELQLRKDAQDNEFKLREAEQKERSALTMTLIDFLRKLLVFCCYIKPNTLRWREL